MRADRGAAGFANGEGGMAMRGESGLLLAVPCELAYEDVLCWDALVETEALESYEVLRDSCGCDVGGGLIVCLSDAISIGFSPKLKRVLVLLGAGLIIAGDILLRKSRYADGGVIGVFRSSFLR